MNLEARLDMHKKVKLVATYIVGMYLKTPIKAKYKSLVEDAPKFFLKKFNISYFLLKQNNYQLCNKMCNKTVFSHI